jgi:protein O-GlcNAc transferase
MKKIFVCGCGHSGTTLIQAILLQHPKCVGIRDESDIFLHDSLSVAVQFLQNVDTLYENSEFEFYIEKTPRHVRKIPIIFNNVLNSQVVVCYRNPLDVVSSLTLRGIDLDAAIHRYNFDNLCWLDLLREFPIVSIRYEDLVENPDSTLTEMCDAIGLDYEQSMLNFWQESSMFYNIDCLQYSEYVKLNSINDVSEFKRDETAHDAWDNHLLFRNYQMKLPITDFRGDWKRVLSPAVAADVLMRTTEVYTKLGYSPSMPYMSAA